MAVRATVKQTAGSICLHEDLLERGMEKSGRGLGGGGGRLKSKYTWLGYTIKFKICATFKTFRPDPPHSWLLKEWLKCKIHACFVGLQLPCKGNFVWCLEGKCQQKCLHTSGLIRLAAYVTKSQEMTNHKFRCELFPQLLFAAQTLQPGRPPNS